MIRAKSLKAGHVYTKNGYTIYYCEALMCLVPYIIVLSSVL